MRNQYFLPVNYTDAGKLLGLFPIRRAAEAMILSVPVFWVIFQLTGPYELTLRIIAAMTPAVLLGGFALMGINDDSLTQFFLIWNQWRKNRAQLVYRGK